MFALHVQASEQNLDCNALLQLKESAQIALLRADFFKTKRIQKILEELNSTEKPISAIKAKKTIQNLFYEIEGNQYSLLKLLDQGLDARLNAILRRAFAEETATRLWTDVLSDQGLLKAPGMLDVLRKALQRNDVTVVKTLVLNLPSLSIGIPSYLPDLRMGYTRPISTDPAVQKVDFAYETARITFYRGMMMAVAFALYQFYRDEQEKAERVFDALTQNVLDLGRPADRSPETGKALVDSVLKEWVRLYEQEHGHPPDPALYQKYEKTLSH